MVHPQLATQVSWPKSWNWLASVQEPISSKAGARPLPSRPLLPFFGTILVVLIPTITLLTLRALHLLFHQEHRRLAIRRRRCIPARAIRPSYRRARVR